MPVSRSRSTSTQPSLSEKIATAPVRHDNSNPLWKGPCAQGPLGGITQSMLVRFLSCRERFRLKYVLGLEPPGRWVKTLGYGNMWHSCEEGLAQADGTLVENQEYQPFIMLDRHTTQQLERYPLQREEIEKWYNVCRVQFPEYIRYWKDHPDVQNRTPLMQEQVFDVSYTLPSGRTVRLRGKFDSVDLIDGGIYLQENKTKGDIDKQQVERQLKFDLQTMIYLIALCLTAGSRWRLGGVRYNVVRRPLSGGVGNIKPHAMKQTKTSLKPAETDDEFYERLRRDYISNDPAYWFFRVRAEVSSNDIQVFKDTCLDPLLETVCDWYEWICDNSKSPIRYTVANGLNYRTPFGVWSSLEEGGSTEYDAYLETGSEAGLSRVETLFTELQ